jgi:ribosomal protein RSM22 (predicted rRNA methylase)
LAELVAKLSTAYNAGEKEPLRTKDALAARLAFSFPRDVPKSAGAVRELVAQGALSIPAGRPLRILDLGAGLGASTWGVVMALKAAAPAASGRIEAVWVDDDDAALTIATAIANARRGDGLVELQGETLRANLTRGMSLAKERGPFDLVLLGQVLSELDASTDEARLALHLEIVQNATDLTARGGSVVIIEPALRERTRRLHAFRDAVLALSRGALTVFAPCLHQAACPALQDPNAWCHEDLDVDLPSWLWPVASAAGLRWQGLTFSYLVLRKDGRTLRDGTAGEALVRAVSEAIVTKGKREAFLCGDLTTDGVLGPQRVRARRLDRDASEANADWEELARGDVFDCAPPIDATKPRIAKDARLRLATATRERGRS